MTDLTIGGTTFKVEVEGDAARPPLMLSNALGTDLTMWDGQVAALAKQFRVIRYDTRGHGGSGGGAAPLSLAALGRDALAILDALDIDRVHWVGLSMGGAIGLWLLANAPERIDRAVLANTAPHLGTPDGWNSRITAVRRHGMAETAAATMERWFSPDFSARAPERVEAIHALLTKTSPDGYAACCAALRDMDLRGTLHDIAHPVLVVTGRGDPVVPDRDAAAFIAGLGARHVALEARHLSNVEAEADFNAALLAFLTAKLPRKARKARPAKAAPAKVAPAKRGGASRRSNAARNPLTKAPTKRAPAKKTASGTPKKKPAETRRRPTPKATATRRTAPKIVRKSPPVKTSVARTPPTKGALAKVAPAKSVVGKMSPAKAARKKAAATTRRPTPTTARSPVKAAVKKAKTNKAAPKTTKKLTAKAPAKKLPASRRKPAAKTRRPTGRRTP